MKETKFKDTEVGLIPEDWKVKRLKDIVTLINGRAYKQEELLFSGKYKVLRVGNFFSNDNWYYSNLELDDKQYCNNGDLLYAWSCTYGAYIWNQSKTIFHYHIWKVIISSELHKMFLQYLLNNDVEEQKKTSQGSTMSHITKGFMEDRVFPIPSLPEQHRIASALTSMDNLISSLDKLIEKKKNIKQGAMQQLLTGKKRLKGFNEPWVVKKLGKLCDLFGRIGFRGYTKADLVKEGEGAISFSPSDIYSDRISYEACTYISNYKYEESPEIKVYNGDIIFCKTASIGKCALVENLKEKATINPQFVVLKNFTCDNRYLFYRLIDIPFQTKIKEIAGGSTIPTMSQEKLKEQTLLMPTDIEEQQAIASLLSSMDKEISSLEVKKSKYERIKQGMMQQLLTGRIRLTNAQHHAKEYSTPINDNYSFAAEP